MWSFKRRVDEKGSKLVKNVNAILMLEGCQANSSLYVNV